MFFSKRRKKKKQIEYEQTIAKHNNYEDLIDNKKQSSSSPVVDMCEQMVEAAKEFEDSKSEYKLVTSYLEDVEVIENMVEEDKQALRAIASNVAKLNLARNEFLKTEHKLSESQFAQMQEMEKELPQAIKRLEENEAYLDKVKRDMRYLEGEKTELEIMKEDCLKEQRQLRKVAIMLLILFASAAIMLVVASMFLKMDTQLAMVIAAFVAVCLGAFVFLKYQEASREIHKCDINRNHAIGIENRVKIKYVNMKNAVDYTCEKYHVKNSYELNYNYDQYIEMCREREKFRQTNDDLDYYNKQMLFFLSRYEMYDSNVWLNHSNAIINQKDMVELKHDLLVRRQKLRTRMEYNLNVIAELKGDILLHRNELGEKAEVVNKILRKISEMDMKY